MRAFLIGGGRDPDGVDASHTPFAEAVRENGGETVAVLVLDEGPEHTDVARWTRTIEKLGLTAEPTLLTPGATPPTVDGAGGVYVAGGLTPGYHEILCADTSWLPAQAVYAGFSAGAAIAPSTALVGGWRFDGTPVCDENAGEELDELELRSGLGLLDALVDVHCAQWGTLGRLVAATSTDGWGIDEHTTLELDDDGTPVAVHGTGRAWHVTRSGPDAEARVTPHRAGKLNS